MLLRFTTADILNTSLIDVQSGERAYTILTVLEDSAEIQRESQTEELRSGYISSTDSCEPCSSSSRPKQRRTIIKDLHGKLVASLIWRGRHPDITIGNEHIGGLTCLFGSSTIRFMPKILAIPTRFDTEYIWTATSESLTLFDYDSETTKGNFHQNAVRIPVPQPLRSLSNRKSKVSLLDSDEPPSPLSSASRQSFLSTSSSSSSTSTKSNSSFVHTGLPGLGSNYLEFTSHPLADDVEIIISFIMMEILRRGRFALTPYTFERPKLWQLSEAREMISKRLRWRRH